MNKLRKNGFTLIEALLGLMTSGIVSILCVVLIECLMNFSKLDLYKQNQFAILQLRELMCVSNSIKVDNGNLSFINDHESYELYFDRNRIVQSPGYEIWMENIDDAYFEEENGEIYLLYIQGNKIFKFEIS